MCGYYCSMVPKKDFQLAKNDKIDYEPFVQCLRCDRKWHQICALYEEKVYTGGFVCENCRKDLNLPRPENKFCARSSLLYFFIDACG